MSALKTRSGANKSARGAILERVRTALDVSNETPARRAAVAARLRDTPVGIVPARGQQPQTAVVDLFCTMAARAQATVERLVSIADVPLAIADYLRARNLPSTVRMGKDPRLATLPWERAPQLDTRIGASPGDDLAAVSYALGGVGETGTVVLVSGSDNPTTLNFLSEHHIVVLNAGDIQGDYEAVLKRMRAIHGPGAPPRTINMITGPSRSADIEQTLLLGAHGPRALHILVV